jgi:hypothetical protein
MSDVHHSQYGRKLGAGLAAAFLAVTAAGCSSSHSAGPASPTESAGSAKAASATSPGPWKLVTPAQAGGLFFDEGALQSGAFGEYEPSVSGINKQLKSAGQATSDAFGLYALKQEDGATAVPVVIFEGYDGTFNPQSVIDETTSHLGGLKPAVVAAGPHGGSAICASSGTGTNAEGFCVWATHTTYGLLLETNTGTQAVTGMPGLMVKLRTDLEVAPGAAPAVEPGQVLVRSSGSGSGDSASFIANTVALHVTYTFKCGAAALNYGDFIASLTAQNAGPESYSPDIVDLAGAGKSGTAIVDAPMGGVRYHVSVLSEQGCNWSMVVRTD